VTQDVSLANYRDALDYLFARTTGGFKFGLERTRALLEHLGNPERRYPALHVAGTNGKGSSVATMAALVADKGYRVATYTSPHLVDFRERMVVGGLMIPADDVIDFVTRYTPLVEEIEASFFEATTAMAFEYFARAGADVAIIEAGLGGRLDSTNVLDPLVAGVTSIGLDHTEYLGNTLEQIAVEKAGIFKPGRAAVVGEREPRIRDLLAERAYAAGASSIRIVDDEMRVDRVVLDDGGTTCTLEWRGDRITLRTPLVGRHQAANLAFSLITLDAAGDRFATSPADAPPLLARVSIPGRFQHLGRFIFDVAHNPAGVEVLVQTIVAVSPPEPIAAIVCVLRDKDWREMIRLMSRVVTHFVFTNAPTAPASRAWDLTEVLAFAQSLPQPANAESISPSQPSIEPVFEAVADFDSALDRASKIAATVLVTGSFHTVGDAMARLQVSPPSG
jgi:dihydrofolate synthase/folylpolyglutamate synthase